MNEQNYVHNNTEKRDFQTFSVIHFDSSEEKAYNPNKAVYVAMMGGGGGRTDSPILQSLQ